MSGSALWAGVAVQGVAGNECGLTLDWNPATVAASHSNLAAVLAGFALAATVLNIEHSRGDESTHAESLTSLFSFLCFIVGVLTSFMYSAATSDPVCVAYASVPALGALLSLTGMLLLVATALLFVAKEQSVARHAVFGASVGSLFIVVQLATDTYEVLRFLGASMWVLLIPYLSVGTSILFLLLVMMATVYTPSSLRPAMIRLLGHRARAGRFGGWTVAGAFGLGFSGSLVIRLESDLEPRMLPTVVALAALLVVSGVAVQGVRVLLHEYVEAGVLDKLPKFSR